MHNICLTNIVSVTYKLYSRNNVT